MRFFVTGGAGYIGSNLVNRLLASGHSVVAYDNFSTGQERFLEEAATAPGFTLVRGDMLDAGALTRAMSGLRLRVPSCRQCGPPVRLGTSAPGHRHRR